MARKTFRRRRRIATQWQNAPTALSLASLEKPVGASPLRNLVTPGTGVRSGTLAAFPAALDVGFDDKTNAVAEFLQEGAVENRTLLRFVGMLRPFGLDAETQAGFLPSAFEVRYALYRGNTDSDESEFEATLGATQGPDLDQPDLFSSSGLSNERIAWMRSFIIPIDTVAPPSGAADFVQMRLSVVQTLPWHKDAALSVIDFQSRRRISTDSKFYLLRQVRHQASLRIQADELLSAELYDASFGRVLTRKVRA